MPNDDKSLDDRLRRALDDIPAPDLWARAAAPDHRVGSTSPPSNVKRWAAGIVAIALFTGAFLFLLSARPGGHVPSPAAPSSESVSIALAKTEGVRCTATMPSVVQPGQPLGPTYTLENVSSSRTHVDVTPERFPIKVEAGDGSTWDTTDLMHHSWPVVFPTALDPGESTTVSSDTADDVAVQFPGPLSVTPTCEGETMPPMSVAVVDPGAAPSAPDAVRSAAAQTSGLLDHCLPGPNSSVVGTIEPPKGADVSGFDARCSASVREYQGFDVVTFLVESPADGPQRDVPEGLTWPWNFGGPPAQDSNGEIITWRFVVTESGATPVQSFVRSWTRPTAGKYTVEYQLGLGGWQEDGGALCGSTGGGGGTGTDAYVTFFANCAGR